MIEPYDKAIKEYIEKNNNSNIQVLNNDDCYVILLINNIKIKLVAERYYKPSLLSSFIDDDDYEYSIWVLQNIFEPSELAKNKEKFKQVETTSLKKENEEIVNYINLYLDQLSCFVKRNMKELSDPNLYIKEIYLHKQKELLSKFGL